jgi:hypothetical protein
MSSHSKQLELDVRWVYWRCFLLVFLIGQLVAWQHVQRLPARLQGHRMMIFLLAPWATRRSVMTAILAGGFLTLVALVLVRLIVRPLVRRWLSPLVDPASGLFHLAAGERVVANLSARRQAGWIWQPGSLTLTDRRLWFFPAAWEIEPWSVRVDELDQVKQERSVLAQFGPIRNWPQAIELWGRSGQEALIATSDPDPLLDWFSQFKRPGFPPDGNGDRHASGEIDG